MPARVDAEGRLVDDGPGDRHAGSRRPQRQHAARRHPEHVRRSARDAEDRVEVVELPLDRVLRRVAGVATAAPVVRDHREPGREQLGQPPPALPATVAERAADEDQGRPVSRPFVGDRRPIAGADGEVAAHAATGR